MADRSRKNLQACYPEVAAGGFTRVDGTVEFYTRINALLRSDMTVLDFGAGRGAQLDRDQDDAPYRTGLCRIQGKVKRLVGIDVDPAVRENPYLDEAHVIELNRPIPLPDESFDLIYADWVIEHVANPERFATEVHRLLKPGGWFCARTPNRWGMTGIGATLIPSSKHVELLRKIQPERKAIDVFPTAYNMNTRRQIKKHFPDSLWNNYTYTENTDPPYVQFSRILMNLTSLYFRLAPPECALNLHVFLQKR